MKHYGKTSPPPSSRPIVRAALSLMLLVLPAGCLGSLKQPALVPGYYQIFYPPPRKEKAPPLPAVIKVRRFTADSSLDGSAIVFLEKPLRVERYVYHRWVADPGPLLSDLLIRDLQAEGRFKAVVGSPTNLEPTFEMMGGLTAMEGRYYEEQARLSIQITFIRNSTDPSPEIVLFQRIYEERVPLEDEEAPELVAALSRAMEKLSARVRRDLTEAVERTLRAQGEKVGEEK